MTVKNLIQPVPNGILLNNPMEFHGKYSMGYSNIKLNGIPWRLLHADNSHNFIYYILNKISRF